MSSPEAGAIARLSRGVRGELLLEMPRHSLQRTAFSGPDERLAVQWLIAFHREAWPDCDCCVGLDARYDLLEADHDR